MTNFPQKLHANEKLDGHAPQVSLPPNLPKSVVNSKFLPSATVVAERYNVFAPVCQGGVCLRVQGGVCLCVGVCVSATGSRGVSASGPGGVHPPGKTSAWADTSLGQTSLPIACWDTPHCPLYSGIHTLPCGQNS